MTTPVLPSDDTRPAPVIQPRELNTLGYRVPLALAALTAVLVALHGYLIAGLVWIVAAVLVFGLGVLALAEHLPVVGGWIR